ncbi:MAG: hypothetical protein QOD09_428 [Bradyrhizobium sp.]|jgi:plasmid stabilization system protein ParE|nr:hypothetical protein [Bradyrhizobium sp.]MEA2954491.1 hypothetical protein [Alphaproteobacteria bacterium]
MILEWSTAALADLDRFAEFLHDRHPHMAQLIAAEILKRTRIISEHPQLGRPVDDRQDYREIVLSVLNTAYVFRYAYDGERLVMLRVFHAVNSAIPDALNQAMSLQRHRMPQTSPPATARRPHLAMMLAPLALNHPSASGGIEPFSGRRCPEHSALELGNNFTGDRFS